MLIPKTVALFTCQQPANGNEREQTGGNTESPVFPLPVLLAANAKGAEILTRVRGMSEADAVRTMHAYVVAVGGQTCPQQVADLLRRYPAQAALGAGCPR